MLCITECEGAYDDVEMCDYWAMRGECDLSAKWMFENCPMSCRICKDLDNMATPLGPFPNTRRKYNVQYTVRCFKLYHLIT